MRRFNDWPIALKLLALLSAASLVPLVAAPLLEFRTARSLLTDSALALLDARAVHAADRIDDFNSSRLRAVTRLASLPLPARFCLASEAERPALASDIGTVLGLFKSGDSSTHLVSIFDKTGTAIAATMPAILGRNYGFRTYFQKALLGQPTISGVFVSTSEAGAIPTIAYAAPMRDAAGNVACVALIVARGQALWDLVRESNGTAGPGSYSVIYDEDGVRIAHSFKSDEIFHPGGRLEPAVVDRMVADKRFGDRTRELLEAPIPMAEEFDRVRDSHGDAAFKAWAPANGVMNFGVRRPLRSVPWTLFFLVPESTLDAPVRALLRATLLVDGALLLLALLTGLFISRWITRPVAELIAAAESIRGGELSAEVEVRGRDEIGRLAGTFNEMTRALRDGRAELEDKVKSRTRELAVANEALGRRNEDLLLRQERQAAFGRALAELAGEGDLRQVLQRALSAAASISDSQLAVGSLLESGGLEHLASFPPAEGTPLWPGTAAVSEALRSRRPFVAEGDGKAARCGVLIPLVAGPREVGLLLSRRAGQHDSDGLLTLAALALPLTLTILRHDLHQQTSHVATELAKSNEELGLQAEELKAQRSDLELKNREIERADRLKSEFLASMSHELRTPLNAIIGFSELLAEDAKEQLSPAHLKFVHDVLASGRHLLALINDILDLAKIEAGKAELELEPVEADAAVAAALGFVGVQALQQRVEVRTSPQVCKALVFADRRKLRQVLLNLLSNAIKFSEPGSVVEVGADEVEGAVRFWVRDQGPGMEPAIVARLFQPFMQGDGTLSRRHQGTGLGLAISKRLVEQHGGTIEVESVPGQGSTFAFTIPTVHAAAPWGEQAMLDTPPSVEPVNAAPAGALPRGSLVLLVEDDPATVRLVRAYLHDGGYRIAEATHSLEALEAARRLHPAAILLDLDLNGEDGLVLLAELKRDPQTRDIPVVIQSVLAEQRRGRILGAVDYLVKPIDRRRILESLAALAPITTATTHPLILAIDDDPVVAAVLRAVLAPEGYRFQMATLGKEGIELALREKPALVMVDLMLPDISGFEVIDRLGKDAATRDIPIIAITAANLSGADRQRLEKRVSALARKGDFTRESVLLAIQRALRTAPPGPAAGPTVVVIDDHDLNRELLRTLLERKGYRTLVAENGDQGVQLAVRESPSIVLLDLAMPGLDGFATLRELRLHPGLRDTPVIAVTALAMRGDQARAETAGFDDYLTKPIDRVVLYETVERLLKRVRPRGVDQP